jgi:hypothetical protein
LQQTYASNYEKSYETILKHITAYTCLHQRVSFDKDEITSGKIEIVIENTAWLRNEI